MQSEVLGSDFRLGDPVVKEPPSNAGDRGSILGQQLGSHVSGQLSSSPATTKHLHHN